MFRDESSHVIKKAKKARVNATTHISATQTRSDPQANAAAPLTLTRQYSADRQTISTPPSPENLPFAQLKSAGTHQPSQLGDASPPSSDDLDQNQHGTFIGIASGASPEKGYWPRQPTEGSLPYDLAAALEEQGVAYFFAQASTLSFSTIPDSFSLQLSAASCPNPQQVLKKHHLTPCSHSTSRQIK
jgi:hypothetical protein